MNYWHWQCFAARSVYSARCLADLHGTCKRKTYVASMEFVYTKTNQTEIDSAGDTRLTISQTLINGEVYEIALVYSSLKKSSVWTLMRILCTIASHALALHKELKRG